MWRLLETGFTDCYTNMAIDEAVFLEFIEGNIAPTLRIYGWNPPAFSLGCSQRIEEELDINKCRRERIDFVRRMTGGSVIYHYKELTYSLVCRVNDISADYSIKESYKASCSFLLDAYERLGLKPKFSGEELNAQNSGGFCFASREKYDIVINGKKIGGNAQKRQRDIIFQHGSIPLELDIERVFYFLKRPPFAAKNNFVSLEELLKRKLDFDELKEVVTTSFEKANSIVLSKDNLTYRETKSVEKLKTEKYQTDNWNLYRHADHTQKAAVA